MTVVVGQRGGEVGEGLFGGEQADLNQSATVAGEGAVLAAGGDQSAAVWADRRPQSVQICRVGDVVEDDQPPQGLFLRFGL
ncbi:hypothetical protein GCM10017687_29660 [Streptomyces echinatus]